MTTSAQSLTEAVAHSFDGAPDPRLKTLMASLTRHLHAFVSETRPTMEEWRQGIDFLTRVGHTCDDRRQEFILLSDVLGVSMLVDAVNHEGGGEVTESTVLGPFFVDNAPVLPQGADLGAGQAGEPLYVDVVVTDASGAPVADAAVDVWQSDSDGFYDVQRSELEAPTLRGLFKTDAAGRLRFWSILPVAYPIPDDGPVGDLLKATGRHPWRPAHMHFKIAAPGRRPLVTHLFVAGDQYLASDAVFGVKQALVCETPAQSPADAPDGRALDGAWRKLEYRFVLGGG